MLLKLLSYTQEHSGNFTSWIDVYHILWLLWVA